MKTKPKRVSYELIAADGVVGFPMYGMLNALITQHRPELADAAIALAWCTSWKPDIDGIVTLGKCKKASDLDRELALWDFIILLRRSFWQHPDVTDEHRRPLLHHELCHAAVKYDHRGLPMMDERGRKVYRVRKHDVEEFTIIPELYGCWTHSLEVFAAALRKAGAPPYVACEACRESPGWVAVVDDAGVSRVRRCACYVSWTAHLAEAV